MSIKLNTLLPITNLDNYKLHLACRDEKDNPPINPLDVFIRSKEEWEGWNRYRGKRNRFNRKYIFALIEFYHEPDEWLFGGIYEVISRSTRGYKVQLVENWQEFIGRLKIHFKRPSRAPAFNLERYFKEMVVSEILNESYTGEEFPGYENINHDFTYIEHIIKTNKPDWKAALINVKGIYLVSDKNNSKRYVGSAYGNSGIWARWACYIGTGHGWNDELTKIVEEKGIGYARSNFVFALLEYRAMKADDKIIIERENYWKEVLLTRGQYGYNKN
jgi:hypothetical protein